MVITKQMTSSSSSSSCLDSKTNQPNNIISPQNNINHSIGDESICCSEMVVKECRICQDEDQQHGLEQPCACSGTLKFAHRKCIQKWCNKKGDITCEICNQVYSPNYALPPPRINPDVMTIDIRHAWSPQIDLRDTRFLTFASVEHQFLDQDYEEYGVTSNTSIAYLRFMALILMIILLIRQALLITRDLGMVPESSKFLNFQVSVLQIASFLLPCYVVSRSWFMIIRQRRRQVQ